MPSLLPVEGMEGGGFLSTRSQEGPPEGPICHSDILDEASPNPIRNLLCKRWLEDPLQPHLLSPAAPTVPHGFFPSCT